MGVDVAAAGSGGGSVVVVGDGDAWRPKALVAPSKVDSLVGSCPWSTPSSAMLSPASTHPPLRFQRQLLPVSQWPLVLRRAGMRQTITILYPLQEPMWMFLGMQP